ncbi:ATP-binding cassette domain-containing protein [Herpetosiphon llansteffanensis]|uniref:ATP-binding cassette domain-containing protein n=1 Tax=Herpetosiphon llansteffanensis TaxID=2094568 RepID=UPI000D7B9677|nr:ATP-binding cassette domain-containing protein [Herpetosiphon llansteffanensis]
MDIQIRHLVKQYGSYRALDDSSLSIGAGMFGLLGPNGAGKTTFMRILTTQLVPTSGEVVVGGVDVEREPSAIRQQLGYLPQEFGFYQSLSAFAMLDYIAAMKNIPCAQRAQEIERVLHEVNLTSEAKRKLGGYSSGMKQRLGIAQSMLGNHQLLVVDEPTVGLDPEERIRFRNVLARIAGQRTVVLSTHIVADIEASCSGVAVLRRSKLLFSGPPAKLVQAGCSVFSSMTQHGSTATLRVLGEPALGSVEVEPAIEEGYLLHLRTQTARRSASSD